MLQVNPRELHLQIQMQPISLSRYMQIAIQIQLLKELLHTSTVAMRMAFTLLLASALPRWYSVKSAPEQISLNCRTHAKTWDLLRLTKAPSVRVDCGYLTNPQDAKSLATPEFRDALAEAFIIAIQRLY
jgi:hypothetical protein